MLGPRAQKRANNGYSDATIDPTHLLNWISSPVS